MYTNLKPQIYTTKVFIIKKVCDKLAYYKEPDTSKIASADLKVELISMLIPVE